MAVLAQTFAAGALEPKTRRIEEGDRDGAEQRLAMPVERLLDRLGHAAAARIDGAQPGHRLIGMVEIELLGAGHAQTVAPFAGVAVGARDHQPVQHGEINRTLDIEGKPTVGEQALEHVAASRLGP